MTTPPALQATAATPSPIRWPQRFAPPASPIHVRNELLIPASPERVWAALLRAERWPDFYANAHSIHFLSHTGPDLRDRSRFRWNTFGLRVTSKVLEFEPCQRLAWDAHGLGLEAWHAWVLTPAPHGYTHLLTEETQHGWLARLGHRLFPNRMRTQHQLWLEGLSQAAQTA